MTDTNPTTDVQGARLARARKLMQNALARAEMRPADPGAIATEIAAALAALESVPTAEQQIAEVAA